MAGAEMLQKTWLSLLLGISLALYQAVRREMFVCFFLLMNSLGTRLASPWMLTSSWGEPRNEAGNWISDAASLIGWGTCPQNLQTYSGLYIISPVH